MTSTFLDVRMEVKFILKRRIEESLLITVEGK
jgi:hypothetical protein